MFNIDLCYNNDGQRGTITVGRETSVSLAKVRINALRDFVNLDVEAIRVYDQKRMKEVYRIHWPNDVDGWIETTLT